MDTIVELGIWTAGAVIVVGIIQWAKGLLSKAPSWLWAVALPATAFIASIALGLKGGDLKGIFWDTAGIWAISQLGYEIIIQTIQKKLSGGN